MFSCLGLAATLVLIEVGGGHGRGARQGRGPSATTQLIRHTVDQLTIRYPSSWVSLPPGGPPTPGLAHVEEYLTDATVVHGCGVGRAEASSARRCSAPVSALRRGQVLVELSEGFYTALDTAATRSLHGHRVQAGQGRITSIEDGAFDCPTGTTNYARTTIDERPAVQETRRARREPVSGYEIFVCANSATNTLPATVSRVIGSLRIAE